MSHQALSPDTEVVLLLCGRFGGERNEPFQPLSARDYGEFAKWLNSRGLRPADLMTDPGREQLQRVHEVKLEPKRLDFLLGRGTAMALALERWSRGGLWVISRGDAEFPRRLRRHLKHVAPPLLYGAGKKDLLEMGGLAIIGSRNANEAALQFTRDVAAQCAREGMPVVSGGARGVDAAGMQGATDAGGHSIGVLANDLLKTSVNRQNRIGLQEGRLVLISPFYPEAGFNAGNAMGRNKYIYALSDRALVVDSALGSGGTWEGALENLNQQWVQLYVRTPGNGPGNVALVDKGGVAFTWLPGNGEPLLDFFERTTPTANKVTEPEAPQQSLLAVTEDAPPRVSSEITTSEIVEASACFAEEPAPVAVTDQLSAPEQKRPALADSPQVASEDALPRSLDMYPEFLAKLRLLLGARPLPEELIAERLGLEQGQARVWLKKATASGMAEKLKNPVRYSIGLQVSLLG